MLTDCIPKRIGCFSKILYCRTDPKQHRHDSNANHSEFNKREDWSPTPPDLNPLNYCIWRILESKVKLSSTEVWTLSKLPFSLREWDKFPVEMILAVAIGQ